MHTMKVAVLNTVLSNTGDAAIFEAICHSLRAEAPSENWEIVALDSSASESRLLYPTWRVIQQPTRSPRRGKYLRSIGSRARVLAIRALSTPVLRRLQAQRLFWGEFKAALKAVSEADFVLSSGGTYLVDHYNFRHRVDEIKFAKSRGKSVFLWTQSLGPFVAEHSQAAAKALAPAVDGVYFRDARSRDAWAALDKTPELSAVCADSVFALSGDHVDAANKVGDAPVALISVRDWDRPVAGGTFDFDRYAEGMRGVASALLAQGWRCIAISTCQGVEGYAINDARTARRIFAGLEVSVDSDFHTPSQLRELLSAADLVVATRMHMAILSLISRTPVMAIAYETKSLELFRSIGAQDAVVPIEDVSAEWALQTFGGTGWKASAALLSDQQTEELRTSASLPAVEIFRSIAKSGA